MVRIAELKANAADAFGGRPAARHLQHLLRCIDRGDPRTAARKQQRGAARAGADVEDAAVLDTADEVGERLCLCAGEEAADRAAKPLVVERPRRCRIGVMRVAVMLFGHYSLAPGAPPPGAPTRRPGFAGLPSGTSLGPQALLTCARPWRSHSAARLRRLPSGTSLGPQALYCSVTVAIGMPLPRCHNASQAWRVRSRYAS